MDRGSCGKRFSRALAAALLTLGGLWADPPAGTLPAVSAGNAPVGAQGNLLLSLDAGRVMGSYGMAKSRDAELKALADGLQKDGQKKLEELMAARKEIREAAEKIDNPALTEEARDRMRAELDQKVELLQEKERNFQQWQEETENRVANTRSELVSRTLGELRVIAAEVAKEWNAVFVLNAMNPDVLYAAPGTDITDEVTARLNRRYPAPVRATTAVTTGSR